MEIEESRLKFKFPDKSHVIKFDDTKFYRNLFNSLPESKGIDFIAIENDSISFIEVKNCIGDEGNCRWRIAPNNHKRASAAKRACAFFACRKHSAHNNECVDFPNE